MPSILLITCFILLFLVIKSFLNHGWRESFLFSALAWGTIVVIITELTSIFHALEFLPIVLIWGSICLALLGLIVFSKKIKVIKNELLAIRLDFSVGETIILIFLVVVVLILGVISYIAPPNTWDSMTYHMSRVIHWVQNKSIEFYPTHIPRQLHQNPWSEYAILQFQILSNGDRFANFIQWFSMVGSLIGVSLIAQRLSAGRRGQLFAAAICSAIPMGIIESTSTQTDYVVSFWLVCFVYFVLQYMKHRDRIYTVCIGISLSLSILTKATTYVFAFPFVIWLSIILVNKLDKIKIKHILIIVLLTMSLNIGHFSRNIALYASPIGPGEEFPGFYYLNRDFSPAALTSNLIRNIGLHLGTPNDRANAYLTKGVNWFHEKIGISPTKVETTWPGSVFRVKKTSYTEDSAGNLFHSILILVTIFFFAFQKNKERDTQFYISALLVGFLLFTSVLRWQPWHSRLHVPFFVLFSPCVVLWIERIKAKWIANAIVYFILVAGIPWILLNPAKIILSDNNIFHEPRDSQYFRLRPEAEAPYIQAALQMANRSCTKVGMILNVDDWEYPLWVLLREKTGSSPYFSHVNVTNKSASIKVKENAEPVSLCAIFTTGTKPPKSISLDDEEYILEWQSSPYNLYFHMPGP